MAKTLKEIYKPKAGVEKEVWDKHTKTEMPVTDKEGSGQFAPSKPGISKRRRGDAAPSVVGESTKE